MCNRPVLLTLLATLLLVTACSTHVVVQGSVPTPLVAKIPARVGIYYSDEFRNFVHQEKIDQEGSFQVDFGDQNLSFFQNLMDALFSPAIALDKLPAEGEPLENLDGLLVPEITRFGFLTPDISGLGFYSVSIHYRLTLYDRQNHKVTDWTVVGYGKSESSAFGSNKALSDATMLAIRDGGARIAIEMAEQPAVRKWLETLQPASGARP